MFEKELRIYLKSAASSLPCSEAKKLFADYVYSVSQDICSANMEKDFSSVLAQLGTDPQQTAHDFIESQPQKTIAKWNAAACRRNFLLKLAVGLTIAAMTVLVVFFVVTKGVWIINTKTTYTDVGNIEYTQEELNQMAEQLSNQIAKEYRK